MLFYFTIQLFYKISTFIVFRSPMLSYDKKLLHEVFNYLLLYFIFSVFFNVHRVFLSEQTLNNILPQNQQKIISIFLSTFPKKKLIPVFTFGS
jgi:hypothetical protein